MFGVTEYRIQNIPTYSFRHEDVLTVINMITFSGGNSIISKTKDMYTLHVSVLLPTKH